MIFMLDGPIGCPRTGCPQKVGCPRWRLTTNGGVDVDVDVGAAAGDGAGVGVGADLERMPIMRAANEIGSGCWPGWG